MNGTVVGATVVELRWTSVDPDAESLVFNLSVTDGAGYNLTEKLAARNITLELSDRAVYTWSVMVSDGNITVVSPEYKFTVRVNRRPVIHSVPVLEAVPGRAYVYQVVATDPDSEPLRYFLADRPGGMGIGPGGRVLWVPSAGQAGKAFRVALTVGDGELEERQEFTIKVGKAPPPAPLEASGPPLWLAAVLAFVLAVEIAVVWILRKGRRVGGWSDRIQS